MREAGENMDGDIGFYYTGRAEGARDPVLSSRYRNGGGYKRMNRVEKE